MPVVQGPLFSLTARNALGKAIVYSAWKGIQYVRTRVVPNNPQTASQTAVREVWKTLNSMWNRMPSIGRAPWTADAAGQKYTDRNKFLGTNTPLLQGDANITDLETTPGDGSALAPLTAISADGGAQVLNITLTQPATPAGWTHVSSDAIAVLQGDPNPAIVRTPIAGQDVAAPFTLVPVAVGAAGTYVWGAWNVYTDPSGLTRYSISLRGTQVIA